MGVDDFRDAFKFYTILSVHNDWQVSFIEKQAAVNKKNYRFNFTITDEMFGKQPSTKEKTEADEDAVKIAKSYQASNSSTFGTKLAVQGTGTHANFDIDSKQQDEEPEDTTNLMLDAQMMEFATLELDLESDVDDQEDPEDDPEEPTDEDEDDEMQAQSGQEIETQEEKDDEATEEPIKK